MLCCCEAEKKKEDERNVLPKLHLTLHWREGE